MGRLVVAAFLVAGLFGAVTVVFGGVEVPPEEPEDVVRATRPVSRPPVATRPPARRTEAGPVGARVRMARLHFVEPRVRVSVGESVRWTNRDGATHDVFAEGLGGNGAPPFQSARLAPGSTYVATFRTPGTFRYACTLHPVTMRGTVEVRPS